MGKQADRGTGRDHTDNVDHNPQDGRPAWMIKDLLEGPKWKKEVYRMWNREQATWEEHRDIFRGCSYVARKDKAHLELNLTLQQEGLFQIYR